MNYVAEAELEWKEWAGTNVNTVLIHESHKNKIYVLFKQSNDVWHKLTVYFNKIILC